MSHKYFAVRWILGAALALPAWAQAPPPPPPPAPPPPSVGVVSIGQDVAFAGQRASFQVLSAEPAFLGAVVTGAPYSADAVTVTTRVLADGTRIENKTVTKLYRDSEGRTRREQAFPAVGALVPGNEDPVLHIAITDPIARTTVILDPRTKTARSVPVPPLPPAPPPPPSPPGAVAWEAEDVTVTAPPAPAGGLATVAVSRRAERVSSSAAISGAAPGTIGILARRTAELENAHVEDLGVQPVEGVAAKGTRRTITIATGAIGNDRPIVSTTEEWFSEELQMVVKRVTKDPQVGEIVYQIENLNRNEPLKDLFEVPADYTVTDTPRIAPLRLIRPSQP